MIRRQMQRRVVIIIEKISVAWIMSRGREDLALPVWLPLIEPCDIYNLEKK